MKSLPAFLLFSALTCAEAQDALTLDKTIPMPEVEGRIDHLAADVAGQRLFVAALGNNTVEVLDLKAGKTIQSLPGFAEPQGIAYVPELNRVFVANGQDGTCRILDGKSLKQISSVECGEDADNVRYDAKGDRIYVGYGGGALAALDTKTGAKLADIKLAGHPESFQLEPDGNRIFINIPDAKQIAVVDRENKTVLAHWRMEKFQANFPMALDAANHRLFVGCRKPARLVILDTTTGKLVTDLVISGDTDDLFYDATRKRLYVSCGEGFIDTIEQSTPDTYKRISKLPTAPGARTSFFNSDLDRLYLAVPDRGSQHAEIRVYQPQQ